MIEGAAGKNGVYTNNIVYMQIYGEGWGDCLFMKSVCLGNLVYCGDTSSACCGLVVVFCGCFVERCGVAKVVIYKKVHIVILLQALEFLRVFGYIPS